MRPEDPVDLNKHLYMFPVQLAGLAARDSLRLKAGSCLYGHNLDETVSPVEAGLNWVIGKDRRTPGDPRATFLGNERVLRELKEGVHRKRVGMIVEGSPARGTKLSWPRLWRIADDLTFPCRGSHYLFRRKTNWQSHIWDPVTVPREGHRNALCRECVLQKGSGC